MTNPIYLKRSAVAGKVPLVTDLAVGELAANSADGILYTRKGTSVVEIGATAFTGDVTGNSSKGSAVMTLADSGVPAGTYNVIDVDSKGRVVSGSLIGSIQILTGVINSYSGTTVVAITNTPTTSNGTQIWSQSMTVNAGTRVLLACQLFGDTSNSDQYITVAFFRNTILIGVTVINVSKSGNPSAATYLDYDNDVTSGVTYTYSCRVGIGSNGTWYINQDKNGNKWGGGFKNSFSLTEVY
jgi:hypothetical protein